MFLIVAAIGVISVFGQEQTDQYKAGIQKSEMAKLDKMIGKWAGSGWIQRGSTREEFVGAEIVQRKIDGVALLVEGRFTAKNEPSRVIHETLAVLSYNPKTNIYDFKTYLSTGNKGDFIFGINGDDYEWKMDFPNMKVVYNISIKNGVWHEIGKSSLDGGKSWYQFFEMTLKKV